MPRTGDRTARRIGCGERLTAALVVVLFSVTPAANQIYRYTDSQGVVHITNVGGSEPAETTAANHPPNLPIMRSSAFVDPNRLGPSNPHPKEAASPKIIKHVDKSGVIRITNRTRRTTTAAGQPPKPVGPVQKLAAAPLRAVSPMPTAAVGAKAGAGLSVPQGLIHCRQDDQGVLHISNSLPKAVVKTSVPPLESNGCHYTIATGFPAVDPQSELTPTLALAQMMRQLPETIVKSVSQIRIGLDRRGILRVSNVLPSILNFAPRGLMPSYTQCPPVFHPMVQEAARRYYLPVPLIHAVIKVESDFVPGAISPQGAQGLMQLMPATANSLGVKDPFCPRENVLAGCLYLRLLLNYFHQSLPLALAAYNAGYPRVVTAGYRVPDIKETRDFVTRVIGLYLHYEKLQQSLWSPGGV
ncbi:MAG: transglycosylase SLT domain-containing protein [Desulfobacteraceae bacterium]